MPDIKPPNWCKDAIMKPTGWFHPVTGEHLVARRFTEDEVASYNDVEVEPTPEPEPVSTPAPEPKPKRTRRTRKKPATPPKDPPSEE